MSTQCSGYRPVGVVPSSDSLIELIFWMPLFLPSFKLQMRWANALTSSALILPVHSRCCILPLLSSLSTAYGLAQHLRVNLRACSTSSHQWHMGMVPNQFRVQLLSDTPAAREEACWFLYKSSCTVLGFNVCNHPESAHVPLDEFNGRMTHHVVNAWEPPRSGDHGCSCRKCLPCRSCSR